MTCADFDRWLDAGEPESGAEAARAHAASCARCASSLAAAREIEALLRAPATAAPAAFTDRVMARVEATSAARARAGMPWLLPAFPWWARAAAEPAAALALVLAAVLAWRAGRLPADASLALGSLLGLATRAGGFTRQLDPQVASALGHPEVQFGLLLGLASLAAAAALPIYQWVERVSGARMSGR